MLQQATICVFFLLSFSFQASLASNGASIIITNAAIDQFVALFMPEVSEILGALSIPDFSISTKTSGVTIQLDLSNIIVRDVALGDVWGTMTEGVGISAGIDEGYCTIDFDWSFAELSYPFSSGGGSGTAQINDFFVSFTLRIFEEDHKSLTEAADCSCTISSFDLTISSDNVNTSLINILTQILNPVISDIMGDFLADAIGDAIQGFINSGISNDAKKEIDDRVSVDWHVAQDIVVTSALEDTPFTGFYYVEGGDIDAIPFAPAPLPQTALTSSYQVFVSFEMFRTAWWAYAQLGYFANTTGTVPVPGADGVLEVALTVADVAAVVPEVQGFYELDQELELTFACAYPTAMEPLYSGIFVATACELQLGTAGGAAAQGVAALEGTLGLAEQPRVFDNSAVGLGFYYHNQTDVRMVGGALEGVAADEAADLFEMLTRAILLPFFTKWGRHIAVGFINFGDVTGTDLTVIFEDTYVGIGIDIYVPS
eukprot:gnl/Chilomastix_cuspidata/631.p1 GENE.gnl/Chilomastix_cuspidata/631~~gnl/Chilomastix_cuspidata/631.p1  ORF type:complete len:485 (+),score=221.92 gnl/Chilomastix_cuspidata/631:158-1612(+)